VGAKWLTRFGRSHTLPKSTRAVNMWSDIVFTVREDTPKIPPSNMGEELTKCQDMKVPKRCMTRASGSKWLIRCVTSNTVPKSTRTVNMWSEILFTLRENAPKIPPSNMVEKLTKCQDVKVPKYCRTRTNVSNLTHFQQVHPRRTWNWNCVYSQKKFAQNPSLKHGRRTDKMTWCEGPDKLYGTRESF